METIQYLNGNTSIIILEDGTKIREYEDIPFLDFPETIDIKITDYCNLGCQYCFESSTTSGIHGDLSVLLKKLSVLKAGVELAIGGGNPLAHPDLIPFLCELKFKGFVANLTINQGHLNIYKDLIIEIIQKNLVKGIGISITSNNFKVIEPFRKLTKNIVYHIIAGINKVEVMDSLITIGDPCKILVLGYKQFGLGINYYNKDIENEIKRWYRYIPKYVGECVLSFDNLAIEQLNIKRLFTDDGWEKFYMGNDFTSSFFIDAVKQEYAPTSRSVERISFEEKTLLDFFKRI